MPVDGGQQWIDRGSDAESAATASASTDQDDECDDGGWWTDGIGRWWCWEFLGSHVEIYSLGRDYSCRVGDETIIIFFYERDETMLMSNDHGHSG